MELSREIFWETNYDKIDWDGKAAYVIERVVQYGTLNDWRTILAYYGKERIGKELMQSRYLDPKSLSFISCIFNIPKEQFRCYTLIQSQQIHWNY
jgi:hypothetical protein